MMTRRTLGHSGLQVSALSLGTMTFARSGPYAGIAASEAEMARMLDLALEAGIDCFDSANVYGAGESEILLGRLLGARRASVVLATKVRFALHDAGAQPPPYGSYGLSRHSVMRAVEGSLQRLGTDYIDLLHLHMQDRAVPVEETLRAVDDLITQGKVRYLGLSNYMAYRLVEALWTCERQQFNPVVSLQLPWSLLKRDGERELIPAARHFGLGVMAYSPLARGMLTGKHRPATPAPGSRMDQWRDEWRENDRARTWEINALLGEIAGQHECAHSAVALAWLLAQRPLASVVLGARSSAQLQENLQCTRLQLSAQQLAQLDLLSAPDWGYPCDFIRRFEPW